MASSEPPKPTPCKVYSFREAIELMKERDKYPATFWEPPIQWVSVQTGKPVSIGYSS